MSSTHCLGPNPHCPCYLLDGYVSSSVSRPSCCSCCNLFSSSSSSRCSSPAAARYRHLLLLCNNTVSGIQRVKSSIISRDVCETKYWVLQSEAEYRNMSRRIHACAKSSGQCVEVRKDSGKYAYTSRSIACLLRSFCSRIAWTVRMRVQRANRAQIRLHATFTPRCVPQKWHALPRSTACHCRDKMRASVNVALFSSHYLWHTVGAQIMGHTGRYSVCHLHCKSLFIVKHQVTFTDIITLALRCLAMSVWESLQQ